SRLTILAGPALDPPELTLGRGWSNAQKSAEDVTDRILGSGGGRPAVIVVAETDAAQLVVAELLDRMGARPADWDFVRARLLAAASAAGSSGSAVQDVAAVAVCERSDPDPSWLFDVG